jgi:hypothetical protein
MIKRSFNQKAERAKEILSIIHSYVCGPMITLARGGYEYFITFTNDYSHFGFVYLIRHKSNSFQKFKEYEAKMERQTSK